MISFSLSVEYISCAPIKVHHGDDGEETEEGGEISPQKQTEQAKSAPYVNLV